MAERTIKIRFDGSAKGLQQAANKAARELNQFGDQARSTMGKAGAESGRGFFSRFASAAGEAALTGGASIASKIGTGIMRGVQSNPWIGAAIAGAIAAVAVVAMPAVGAAMGVALIGGLGAGLAGIGILVQAQTKKVKSAFEQMKTDVVATLRSVSEPMQGVILHIFEQVQGLVDFMAPTLRKAFQSMAPHLKQFFGFVFEAFKQFKPAIIPVTEAFNTLLDAIGPMLPKLAQMIAGAIMDIAKTIKENPAAFQKLIAFFLAIIPLMLDWINKLMELYVWFTVTLPNAVESFKNWVKGALNTVGAFFNYMWERIKAGASNAWGWIRGVWNGITGFFGGLMDGISAGVSAAWGWIERRISSAANWVQSVWRGVGGFFSGLWSGIVSGLKGALNGVIWVVNGAIRGINWIIRQVNRIPLAPNIPTIPTIPQLAKGGTAEGGRSYLVGEKGPELFTPGRTGHVTPNNELGGGPGVLEAHIEIGGEVVRVVRSEISEMKRGVRRAASAGAR